MTNSEATSNLIAPRREWRYALRRAYHGFMLHRGIDSAATLAFFSALATLPAALSVVSAFALAQGEEKAAETVLDLANEVLKPATVDVLKEPLTQLFSVGSPGLALAMGLVLSVWSLSSYATAFGRAANSVYEVHEGRRFVKFRGLMLVLSAFLLAAFAAVVVLLLTTTNVATAIGTELGIGDPWVAIWSFGRWPVLLAILTVIIAVLYYYTPNIRHERMRWVSTGALFAIVTWGLWLARGCSRAPHLAVHQQPRSRGGARSGCRIYPTATVACWGACRKYRAAAAARYVSQSRACTTPG